MSMYPDYYGYDYGYSNFGSTASDAVMGVAGALLGILVVVYLLVIAFSIVSYVLGSLGMYTMAKRRGIHHPWLAWIPVANVWTLGSISDQYQYVAKGKVHSRRKVLLALDIVVRVASFPVGLAIGIMAAAAADMTAGDVGAGVAVVLVLCLVLFAVAIVKTVFGYMCYYDLFASSKPDNAVAFLVVGIFFNFLLPFFVFACRKHDQGMPPRKPQIPVQPVYQPTWQPAAEPVRPVLPTASDDVPVAEESDFEEPAAEETDDE